MVKSFFDADEDGESISSKSGKRNSTPSIQPVMMPGVDFINIL